LANLPTPARQPDYPPAGSTALVDVSKAGESMGEVGAVKDEYLLEVYRQAGENARMYATSRFSNLSSFLTYVSILTAALALVYSEKGSLEIFRPAAVSLSVLGLVVSVLFLALEVRHHYWWQYYELHVVRTLEQRMGVGQYPESAGAGLPRDFVGAGHRNPLARLGATRATYGLYGMSVLFFCVAGTTALVL
jgi:hypothetical protein